MSFFLDNYAKLKLSANNLTVSLYSNDIHEKVKLNGPPGSFSTIFVFWQRARLLRARNLVHQFLDAWKPVMFSSSVIAGALIWIMLQVTM